MKVKRRSDPVVERLWQCAGHLPRSVRLLGTRYRLLFSAYAARSTPVGEHLAAADALGFIDFMCRQDRLGLLAPERRALKDDDRRLRRRFRFKREGANVEAVEKWKLLQWLSL